MIHEYEIRELLPAKDRIATRTGCFDSKDFITDETDVAEKFMRDHEVSLCMLRTWVDGDEPGPLWFKYQMLDGQPRSCGEYIEEAQP